MTKVICEGCKIPFQMETSKFKQRQKINGSVRYCSNACFHKHTNRGKSAFTYYVDKSKRGKWNTDLNTEYLKEIWIKQKGICPYTGIKMILPAGKREFGKYCSIEKASLDRIDPSKGYLKGNVEFVCQGINFAKNDYSKEEVLRFIAHIKTPD